MDVNKKDKIADEVKRISGIFATLDAKTKAAVGPLIQNAAFMAVTLQELQEVINEKGVVETYQNGANQHGVKKSSNVEVYNIMVKNYSSIMKQLTDLLPKDKGPAGVKDDFDDFRARK
jgi:predicted transcriptional regulator